MTTTTILPVFAFGAAVSDAWKGKIYNAYLAPGFLLGMLVRIHADGWSGLAQATISAVVVFAALLPVWALKGIGAGDVKLLSSMATFLSCKDAFTLVATSFAVAALVGGVRLLVSRGKRRTLHFAAPVFLSVALLQGVLG